MRAPGEADRGPELGRASQHSDRNAAGGSTGQLGPPHGREHNSILPLNGRRIMHSTRGLSFVSLKGSAPLKTGWMFKLKILGLRYLSPVCSSLHLGRGMSTAPGVQDQWAPGNSGLSQASLYRQQMGGSWIHTFLQSSHKGSGPGVKSQQRPKKAARLQLLCEETLGRTSVSSSPSQEVPTKPSPKHRIMILPIPQSHLQEVLRVNVSKGGERRRKAERKLTPTLPQEKK